MGKTCIIEIDESKIALTLQNGDILSSKVITLGSLLKLLGNLSLSFELLPKNCRFVSQQGELTHYCVEIEAQHCPMTVERNDVRNVIPKIYHPNNLFIFSIFQNQILSSFCVCTKEPIKSLNDEIFRSPFGNTHHDGRICWGNTDTQQYTVSNLHTLALTYYTSGFNGELDENSFSNIDLCKKHFNPSVLRSMGQFGDNFPQFKQLG